MSPRIHAHRVRTLTLELAFVGLFVAAPAIAAPLTGSMDRDPTAAEVSAVVCPVGTTIDDLIAQGLIPDPRIAAGTRDYTRTDVDPGTPVEGDYLGWAAYTRDGARLFLTNRGTDNVTVFDTATRAVITNIPVGGYPSGIAVTDDYAIITCPFENRVQIIDVDTYGIVGEVPTGVQPWVIRIGPDQARAYVACDISNTLEVIDIANAALLRTIPNFPFWLSSWSSNSENGRLAVQFSDFELAPDEQHAVVSNGEDRVLYYNLTTGAVDYTVPNIPTGLALALSGDRTQLVVLSATDPVSLRRIDLATHAVTGTVAVTGYSYGYLCLGVDWTGAKAFTGVSNNVSAFIRFGTSDFTIIPQTYTAFWIGTSPDHAWVVSGQYRFTILAFATESILGQYQGLAQSSGAVSPVAAMAVGYDPHRHEGLYFYAFPTGVPVYLGTTNAGEEPEGDCPRRVAIAPDGSKAVVTNVLSDNAVILNLTTLAVEATLPISDRPQDIAITPDSRYAVICGFGGNGVKILDLTTDTIVADVYTGAAPGVVAISPDGTKAYVGNISSNTVSIVALAGAGSYKIADVPAGEIGVVWAAYGVSSGVAASPDNRYALVATSFDDVVRVIDSQTSSVVATIPVGDFPLQLAFDGDGSHAIVTNYFGNSYTVLRINGSSSYAVGTFSRGMKPMRLDFDPVRNRTLIGNFESKTVTITDPETGALLGTQSYTTYGYIDGVIADYAGDPVVLASAGATPPGWLIFGPDAASLPATPSYFDYCPARNVAVVAMPGPDWVTVIQSDAAGAPEVVHIPLDRAGAFLPSASSPLRGPATLEFVLTVAADTRLDLTDVTGRAVASIACGRLSAGRHALDWTPPAAGAYFARLQLNGRDVDARKLVVLE
jgi:YVTN family beta-propeller protein